MNEEYVIEPIAKIVSDLTGKFGVPRQAGIAEELLSEIVFLPEYSDRQMLRGIEEFSHLWLIWRFSENAGKGWSPTVRPPRLGGNERRGVLATRSPFRPNALGLSCVKLVSVNDSGKGMPTLTVAGADLMNGTPIVDIKPYIPYADCIPDALSGFAPDSGKRVNVVFAQGTENKIPEEKLPGLKKILSLDPRPQYIRDGEREYSFEYAGRTVSFTVLDGTLTVTDIKQLPEK